MVVEGKGNVPVLPTEKTNDERLFSYSFSFFSSNLTAFPSLSIRKISLKKKKFNDHKA